MGKVKRVRQKYHNSLKKEEDKDGQMLSGISIAPKLMPVIDSAEERTTESQNMFAGLQIKLDIKSPSAITSNEEFDRMSVSSSTTYQNALSKKARRQLRKEAFLKKIDTVRSVEKEQKDRKMRAKTAIVGDVHPMLNALPALEELLPASHTKVKPSTKKIRSIKKEKEATKDMMSDIQMFVTVNRDPEYNRDPFSAVSRAVQNRVLFEEEANEK